MLRIKEQETRLTLQEHDDDDDDDDDDDHKYTQIFIQNTHYFRQILMWLELSGQLFEKC